MPTLVVHTSQLQDARDFLNATGLRAHLVPFETGEREPKREDARFFAEAEVAFVGVRRPYVQACERLGCHTVRQLASIRGGSRALIDWLSPQTAPVVATLLPSAAFDAAAETEARLVLADGALDAADEIVEYLHPFVNRAAEALREYAACEARAPGGLATFFSERDVEFAPAGGAEFRYEVLNGRGAIVEPLSQLCGWHLKRGDRKNTPEECARIYFHALRVSGLQRVIVAKCGPHPPGDFRVVVHIE